jgi:hypothetical protein
MQRAERDGLEDEHLQRALGKFENEQIKQSVRKRDQSEYDGAALIPSQDKH